MAKKKERGNTSSQVNTSKNQKIAKSRGNLLPKKAILTRHPRTRTKFEEREKGREKKRDKEKRKVGVLYQTEKELMQSENMKETQLRKKRSNYHAQTRKIKE